MFKRILISLDGSDLSERALEPAFVLARQFAAAVILVRVIAPEPTLATGSMPYALELEELHQQQEHGETDIYLKGIRSAWMGVDVAIETHSAVGAPPEMILQTATDTNADLIVMSTHGRSGLDRFLYGSVAEAVLRGTRIPLLLIPVK